MTTPYIGSKISLISKSEIRYEGILYTVDPKESTIALAKVRSYGTEDRPTENPVPPRQEVYEYIIFKASDIKDLVVCETPQPVPSLMPGLPYDPAIVSVSKHPQTGSQLPTANASGVAASSTGFGDGSKASDAISQATAQLGGFQISKGHASTASGNSSRPSTPLHRGVSPSVDAGVQAGGPQSRAPGAGRQTVSNRNGQSGGNGYQAQRYRRGSGGYQNNRGGYVNGPRDQRDQRDQHNFNRVGRGGNGGFRGRGNMGGGGMMRGGRGGNYQGYQGGYQRGQQQNYGNRGGSYYPRGGARGGRGDGTERVKYDNDYDFEKANEQFQETLSHLKDGKAPKGKDDEKSEVEKGDMKKSDSGSEVHGAESEDHESSEKACYDKTKSFFDKISCEALERSEGNTGRPNNWRKERELNQETFGQNAVRNYNFRRGQPRGGGNVMGGGYRRGGNMRGGYNKYRSGGNF